MELVLNHIGLAVTDTQRSAHFYCSHFHFTMGKRYQTPEMKILLLHQGSTVIELLERGDGSPVQHTGLWDHIAFSVDDLDAVYKRLLDHKVELIDQQPRMSVFGKRILFLTGPDGERIELIEA